MIEKIKARRALLSTSSSSSPASRGRARSVPLSPAQDSLADTNEKLEEYSDYV